MTLLNGFEVTALQRRSQRIAHQHLWNTFKVFIPTVYEIAADSPDDARSKAVARFKQEQKTSVELKALVSQFRKWYNQERLHSSLGYQVPWQRFLADVAALT
jgi:hypothetical protein